MIGNDIVDLKFYLQKKPSAIRGFYPAKIETQLHSSSMGLVSIKGIVLSTTSIIHPDYIFSTAFFYQKKLLPFNCSLTHHGNYGGYSISSI